MTHGRDPSERAAGIITPASFPAQWRAAPSGRQAISPQRSEVQVTRWDSGPSAFRDDVILQRLFLCFEGLVFLAELLLFVSQTRDVRWVSRGSIRLGGGGESRTSGRYEFFLDVREPLIVLSDLCIDLTDLLLVARLHSLEQAKLLFEGSLGGNFRDRCLLFFFEFVVDR